MYRIAVLLFLVSLPAFSQEPTHEAKGAQTQNKELDYRIGPADVLSISVLGAKEFGNAGQSSLTLNVSNSGKIRLPLLGVLPVNGLNVSDLEFEIARRLRGQDLIKEPQVQVRVADYRAHNVYIIGEVMQGGQFILRDKMYLTDLISMGMNLGETANSTIYLYRRRAVQTEPSATNPENNPGLAESALDEAIKINVKELMDGTRPDLNLQLQGGDILYCPMQLPENFYVVGDVKGPGTYKIPKSGEGELRVSQAIALAGGPTRTARMSKGLLIRHTEAGVRQELAVDFKAIYLGKKPDFPVRPDDIIFIPGSQAKSLGYGLLGIVPQIASMALIF